MTNAKHVTRRKLLVKTTRQHLNSVIVTLRVILTATLTEVPKPRKLLQSKQPSLLESPKEKMGPWPLAGSNPYGNSYKSLTETLSLSEAYSVNPSGEPNGHSHNN